MKLFDLYIRILKKQLWLYMIYLFTFLCFIMLTEQTLISYYRYAVPILMVLIMLTISAVTAVTSNVELSLRHRAAPVRIELLELGYVGADLLVMLFWWMLFFWTAVIFYGEPAYSVKGLLMAVNLLTVSLLSTALGYITGIFTKSAQGRGIAANLIAGFLIYTGGTLAGFQEKADMIYFLRSFTPIFWYQKALEELAAGMEHMMQKELYNYAAYMGMQLMFAFAVLAFGMMLDKQRKGLDL